MDINLGDIVDGTYLTRVLRNNSKYKETPILAFTAYALDSEKEEFISAGFSDLISKPFTKSELHNKIQSNLNKVVKK
jgi:CheY-like chemotaxis protein